MAALAFSIALLARRLRRTIKHDILCLSSFTLLTCNSPSSSHLHSLSSNTRCHHYFNLSHPTLVSHSRHFSTQIINYPLGFNDQRFKTADIHNLGLTQFLEFLQTASSFGSEAEAIAFLDESCIEVKRDTVFLAIWELRQDWKMAYLGFKWGDKWECCDEEVSSLMVWVLGSHRKFTIAWCLIRDLNQALMDTRRAMLIMIDRYASANHPSKAIKTFQIMEKFRLSPDREALYTLLNALCRNGNIEEAEEFLLISKKFFPLEVEGFNIVLNGWCNISVDVSEAKRVWREMSKYCITPDATSYTHMISCFSKVQNLFDSLRLYDEMKKRSWVPSLKVYNSLIYVLTSANCFKEALKVLDKVKEMDLKPDCTTYNSMICPLCELKKLEEARRMLSAMVDDNLSPTIETYHAFLQSAGLKGTLEVLNRMKKANLGPNGNTFLTILGKFILEHPGNALEIWNEMKQYGVVPDSTHYTVMIQGLATRGLMKKAKEFFAEMTSNGFSEDPKLKKLLKKPIGGSSVKGKRRVRQVKQVGRIIQKQGRVMRSENPRQSGKKKTSSG